MATSTGGQNQYGREWRQEKNKATEEIWENPRDAVVFRGDQSTAQSQEYFKRFAPRFLFIFFCGTFLLNVIPTCLFLFSILHDESRGGGVPLILRNPSHTDIDNLAILIPAVSQKIKFRNVT